MRQLGDVSLKAITIRQPWVELILQGRKPYEIRSWRTLYRGPIMLHAAKALDKSALVALEIDASSLFRGGFVGRAELKDCRPFTERTRGSCGRTGHSSGNGARVASLGNSPMCAGCPPPCLFGARWAYSVYQSESFAKRRDGFRSDSWIPRSIIRMHFRSYGQRATNRNCSKYLGLARRQRDVTLRQRLLRARGKRTHIPTYVGHAC